MSIYRCRTLEDIEFSRMTRTEQLLELNGRLRSIPTLMEEHHENIVFEIARIRDMLYKKQAKKMIAALKKDQDIASPPPPSSSSSSLDPLISLAQIIDVAGTVLGRVEGRHSADAALVDYLKQLMKNAAIRVEEMKQPSPPQQTPPNK